MKRYEKESFSKSFLLFFILQLILLFIIAFQDYHKSVHSLRDKLKENMKVCSFSLDCKEYEVDFVDKNSTKLTYNLQENNSTLYTLYKVPSVDDFYLKIYISKDNYNHFVKEIKVKLAKTYAIYLVLIILLSYLFSLYTLSPLKKALRLNEEFVKDILHDFNTPISSIVINLKMLQRDKSKESIVKRMQNSIDNILSLQENLKYFLKDNKLQKSEVELGKIVLQRVEYFKNIYKNLEYKTTIEQIKINSNQEAIIRIIDNLLSNASKYNKQNGFIKVTLNKDELIIEDSGKGIENVDKIFDRYYKENDIGLGIGMHIVKKFSDDLNISIELKSKLNIGTVVKLDFSKVIVE